MGYDAASTDIGMNLDVVAFRRLGIAFCCIYSVMVIAHCIAFFVDHSLVKVGYFCCANIPFIIMAPIAWVRLRDELSSNQSN